MTKSELIDRMVEAQAHAGGLQLTSKDVELAVKTMLEQMSGALASGGRIEIRGFGSFSLHYRAPRIGRNPKTCLLYTSPSPRDRQKSRMPSSA